MSRHIAVYTELSKKLYPSAHIMVIITSLIVIRFRSSKSKQRCLAAALKIIPSDQLLMMHVSAEGGSNKACALAEAFEVGENVHLSVKTLCLDSIPGKPNDRRLCKTFSKALPPSSVVAPVGLVDGGIVLSCKWVFYGQNKRLKHNVVSNTWNRLLYKSLWDLARPRCDLFSERDDFICSNHVEDHAAALRSLDIQIENVDFKTGGHLQHAKHDP